MSDQKSTPPSPEPLTPKDCDLRDYPFVPIERQRLLGSTFNSKSSDAEWRAGVTLWLKSFDQVPAGSLPDDDDELTRLAEFGRDTRGWLKVKSGAMRGWVKCADGRLYHPVVCEKALEGWLGKLNQRKSSAAGNAKRHNLLFDPRPFDEEIAGILGRIRALNPNSRALNKEARRRGAKCSDEAGPEPESIPAAVPPGEDRDRVRISGGVASGPQETETETVKEKDIPKASPSGADAPPVSFGLSSAPDVRAELFEEGLTTIMGLTGRSEVACRTYLGRGLKELKDDAAVMLDIIRLAKARRPADPISWISASIKARAVGKPTFEEKMMEAVGLDARKGVAGPIIDHSQAELLVLE
jgi:hypothetical protein